MDGAPRTLAEHALGGAVADAVRAEWGFTSRTDLVTLTSGERVVVQHYGRRHDAEYRLQVMQGLRPAASDAGVVIPEVRAYDLSAEPPWIIFDALPGVPVPAAGETGLGGPQFAGLARAMGELLARLRRLPTAGLWLNATWADTGRLAAAAGRWIDTMPLLSGGERDTLAEVVSGLPQLFAGRPVVLAHGDFAPVNMLTDGASVTGLLDFEAARLADPLFDVAWWAWSVSLGPPCALETGWAPFLDGAGVDAADPLLHPRIRALQVLRMLELLVDQPSLSPDVRRIVADRLRAKLRPAAG
jgi:aminoglycoside phosphotransferase (APT) family kinase protein